MPSVPAKIWLASTVSMAWNLPAPPASAARVTPSVATRPQPTIHCLSSVWPELNWPVEPPYHGSGTAAVAASGMNRDKRTRDRTEYLLIELGRERKWVLRTIAWASRPLRSGLNFRPYSNLTATRGPGKQVELDGSLGESEPGSDSRRLHHRSEQSAWTLGHLGHSLFGLRRDRNLTATTSLAPPADDGLEPAFGEPGISRRGVVGLVPE